MKNRLNPIVTLGAGAALMYFLDPKRGARRRGLILQKGVHYTHKSEDLLDKAARDALNRGRGLLASTRSAVKPFSRTVPDEILIERLRSKLGRYVSHPHAIHLSAQKGSVRVEGQILKHEADRLMRRLERIEGVRRIEDRLERHKNAEHLPSLQGGLPRPGEHPDFLQSNWAPATRILFAGLGAGGVLFGIRRRDLLGSTVSLLGLAALLRAATNSPIPRLIGITGGRSAITVRKTINVSAPVDRVFGFWENPENFPRFMVDVKTVRILGVGRSHWTVRGPGGMPLSWESEITRQVRNELLAWRSIEGSIIPNAGRVRFRRNERGGTRIELEFSYHPPVGILGHFAAVLFGSDPKSRLDEALGQMKTLIELGPSARQRRRGFGVG